MSTTRRANKRARVAPAVLVKLPTPKGRRRALRVTLAISMHPSQLEALRARARHCEMSLTGYVAALLDSDAEDVWTPPTIEATKGARAKARAGIALALAKPLLGTGKLCDDCGGIRGVDGLLACNCGGA